MVYGLLPIMHGIVVEVAALFSVTKVWFLSPRVQLLFEKKKKWSI